jgi:hypothetical protein
MFKVLGPQEVQLRYWASLHVVLSCSNETGRREAHEAGG